MAKQEPSALYRAVRYMVEELDYALPVVAAHAVRRAAKDGLGVPRPALVFDAALRQAPPGGAAAPACPALMALLREACAGRPDLWDPFLLRAARHGHAPVCEAIVAERPGSRDLCDVDVCGEAAAHGHVHLIEWALARGFAPRGACFRAAEAGDLATARWLLDRVGGGGAERTTRLAADFARGAAAAGSMPVLQWARDSGCPEMFFALPDAAARGQVRAMQWIVDSADSPPYQFYLNRAFDKAAEAGHVAVQEWAEAGGWWRADAGDDAWRVFFAAVEGGQVEVLQWLLDRHRPPNSHAFGFAVRRGHAHVVRWLLERGCRPLPGAVSDTAIAAERGDLPMLRLLLDNGFPACPERCTVAAAAAGGGVAALELLRDRRVLAATEEALDAARAGGHEAALQWLERQRRKQ